MTAGGSTRNYRELPAFVAGNLREALIVRAREEIFKPRDGHFIDYQTT